MPPPNRVSEADPASPKRVMVVEDEGLIAHDIGNRLRRAGYEVAGTVDSGEEAVERVSELSPDVVLMDIRLSGELDGIETARLVQEQLDVPVIYLTAHSDRDTLKRALITSPFGYLTKPLGQSNLPVSIEMALYKHQAERELRQQRSWLSTILKTIADGVIVTNPHHCIEFLNPTAEALTGWRAGDAIEKPLAAVFRLLDPESDRIVDTVLSPPVLDALSWPLPSGLRLLHHSGSSFLLEGEVASCFAGGRTLGSVLSFRDVTARRALEQEMHQQQKMQAIGRIAAGIAHDFGNLLTIILGQSEMIRMDESASLAVLEAVQEVERAASAAASVTRQLLSFCRRDPVRPELVNLNQLITDYQGVYRRLLGQQIELKCYLEPGLPPLYADPGQLTQVLLNLFTNARDAINGPGVVTIETSQVALEEPDRYVVLTVKDTGPGMDAETAERLFEPFFTTKTPGRGTGLGLSIVYSVITSLGGTISVNSEPGHGAAFTVYLPLARTPDLPLSSERAWSAGLPTILLVTSDADLRGRVREHLTGAGYHLIEAEASEEALTLTNLHAPFVDVLLTEALMPDKSGFQLAEELRLTCPSLRTIFMSDDLVRTSEESSLRKEALLLKPFRREDLLAAVRLALHAAKPSVQ